MSGIGSIRQYNSMLDNDRSLIRKALDSSTSVAEALIPQKLEQVITNTVLRLSPELSMIAPRYDNQKSHKMAA